MNEQLITCPHCNKKFPLSEAMQHEIEAKVKTDHQKEMNQLETEYKEQITKAKKEAAEQAIAKAKKENQVKLTDLENQVKEFETKTKEFNTKELAYLKKEREIKAKESNLEVERQKFINETTDSLKVTIREEVETEIKGKLSEKDIKIAKLEELAKELQKKAQQGSMEEQGEAFEAEIENYLKICFQLDEFEQVLKGQRGADIIHRVKTISQKTCGTILWEVKNADNWQEKWVTKLKDDQRQIEGESIGIIITRSLPKSVKRFGLYDGIWVTDFYSVLGLATVIREKFLELHQVRAANAAGTNIMDLVYTYVTGSQLRTRIEASAESLIDMKTDIDKERAAMERNWAKREKQIFRVVQNIAGLHGDFVGLGAKLQPVKTLELDSGEDEVK